MRALGERSIASFMKSALDVAWWGAAIALGLLVILVASLTLLELRVDNLTMTLPVAVRLDAPIHGAGGETEAHFESLRGNLRFPVTKGPFLFGSLTVIALMLGYLLWIVTQLRHVFQSLSQGLPFVVANARRVRWIGLAVIAGEFGRAGVTYFWSYYTSLYFAADGVRFAASVDVSLITMVSGVAILAIAEVFQQGARLQEDQSLTI